jgi:hypothetical protein
MEEGSGQDGTGHNYMTTCISSGSNDKQPGPGLSQHDPVGGPKRGIRSLEAWKSSKVHAIARDMSARCNPELIQKPMETESANKSPRYLERPPLIGWSGAGIAQLNVGAWFGKT